MPYDICYMKNGTEMIQMNLFVKQKQTHRLREEVYGCWGEWRERIVRVSGMDMYTWLYLK